MRSAAAAPHSYWEGIRLVVFDVDGTLYRQRSLRMLMARDLLFHTVRHRDLTPYRVLRVYRQLRERLAGREAVFSEAGLVAETASAAGESPETVRATVAEWIGRRPLPYLAGCRYPALPQLFAALKRNGKMVGILSDYPAGAKLAALGVAADHQVAPGEDGLAFLKPHVAGLEILLARAGVEPEAAVVIGDRVERDGLVARRLGARALIRSSRPIAGWETFSRYDDPLFLPLLTGAPLSTQGGAAAIVPANPNPSMPKPFP